MLSGRIGSVALAKVGGAFGLATLVALAGCSGGGMALLGIAPTTAQTIDAGQVLGIQATVINDVLHQGVTVTMTGVGTIATSAPVPMAESSVTTISYTAPAVTAPATATVTASAIRTAGQTGSVTITVNPAYVLSSAVPTLPSGSVATPYSSATLTTTGGTGVSTYSLLSGSLPAGLSLNPSSGLISGTPVAGGSFAFTVGATDASTVTNTLSKSYTLTITPVILTATVPNAVLGIPYMATLAVAGSGTGATFAITSGSLPATSGLTLSAAGVITGTPAGAPRTVYSFTVVATQGGVNSLPRNYSIALTTQLAITTASSLPAGGVSMAYSLQFTSTGGSNTGYSYSVTAGALPAGLTLSPTGFLNGTPTTAGTSTFTLKVTDSAGATATGTFTLTFAATPLTITTAALPGGRTNVAYSQQLAYAGGSGGSPVFALASGALPGGLTLSNTGLISGSPTVAGTFTFSVSVAMGTTTSPAQPLSISISNVYITSGAAANGEAGLTFYFPQTVSGGSAPYKWQLAAGSNALPAGFTLSATSGTLAGTPATAGTTAVTIMVSDANGFTTTQALTITIAAARTNVHNAQLTGQYAFLLSGFDAGRNPIRIAGKVTFTGAGTIIGGVEDVNGTAMSTPGANIPLLASTYTVGADNRGLLTLTTAAGSTQFTLALNQATAGVSNTAYLTQFDGSGQTLTGLMQLQDPTAFTNGTLAAGYAFGVQGFQGSAAGHTGIIGEFQLSSGNIPTAEILSAAAGPAPLAATGTYAIAANGRGTLTLTLANGSTLGMVVYVVSANQLYLVSSGAASGSAGAALLSGQATAQTTANGAYTAASLNGTAVGRYTRTVLNAAATAYLPDVKVGVFTFAGTGTGSFSGDENSAGTATRLTTSGSYTVAPNGRVALALAPGIGGCVNCAATGAAMYLSGLNRGYYLDFLTGVDQGSIEPQTLTTYNTASFAGTYVAGTVRPVAAGSTFLTEALTASGTGAVTLTEDQNGTAGLNPDQAVTAAYTVAPNGRVALTGASDGSLPILYLISPGRAFGVDLAAGLPVSIEVAQ